MKQNQFKQIKKYLELQGYNNINFDNLKDKIREFQIKKNIDEKGYIGQETLWALQYEPTMDKGPEEFATIPFNGLDIKVRCEIKNKVENLIKYIKMSGVDLSKVRLYGAEGTDFHELENDFQALGLAVRIGYDLHSPDLESKRILIGSDLDLYAEVDPINGCYSEIEVLTNRLEVGERITLLGNYINMNGLLKMVGFTRADIKIYKREQEFNNNLLEPLNIFESKENLTEGFSLFGIELLKNYKLKDLEESVIWVDRKAILFNGWYHPHIPVEFCL